LIAQLYSPSLLAIEKMMTGHFFFDCPCEHLQIRFSIELSMCGYPSGQQEILWLLRFNKSTPKEAFSENSEAFAGFAPVFYNLGGLLDPNLSRSPKSALGTY
jgi:hypothetical protein